ncbi:hypothetical protein BU26DRAFT_94733 [Trematosphaeria pertusa]|uniref:Uncharacterized protein n=1 Tax=Trematosphaeria pertusa TaxID=390896 RepID=A0A6A6I1W7_9PLEO|nr:uncharacterized protein BU26DRAFT_94733 [Trematosphaeria pertusa]KAF2244139.1 hypothetical protein BU26DRAFT_94733 [Trematosphaeria pertusa]
MCSSPTLFASWRGPPTFRCNIDTNLPLSQSTECLHWGLCTTKLKTCNFFSSSYVFFCFLSITMNQGRVHTKTHGERHDHEWHERLLYNLLHLLISHFYALYSRQIRRKGPSVPRSESVGARLSGSSPD